MDPCPFVRVTVESLALRLPVASRRAGPGVHASATPCFCKIQLHNLALKTTPLPLSSSTAEEPTAAASVASVRFNLDPALLARLPRTTVLQVAVYTGRMGATCGIRSGKLLGRLRVEMDLSGAGMRAGVYQNGWTRIGRRQGEEKKPSARLHLVVRSEPDPRFVFHFGGDPECSPVVFQIQGHIRQPVFTCKFTAGGNTRSRSLQLDYSTSSSRRWLKAYKMEKDRSGRERKGWRVVIFDLSGSPVAAASMTTPFVPSPGTDRVSRSNPGAWLILRPNGVSDNGWKPWARLQAWREKSPIDALGYKLELMTDAGPAACIPIAESHLSLRKGGRFCIDSAGETAAMGGFIMGSTVEGEGKVSKPTVEVGVQHVGCMADAALFVALSAAIDLSMDACRLFSHKLRKELCHDDQDRFS